MRIVSLPTIFRFCFLAALVQFVPILRADVVQSGENRLFGISASYNDVFFGDYFGRGGDTEGHLAVQGSVDVQSHGFGAFRMEKHQDGPVLVVGGDVIASGTTVHDGNAYIGGKLNPQKGNSQWNSLGVSSDGVLSEPGYQGSSGTIYVNDDSTFNRPYNVPGYHKSFAEGNISELPFDFGLAKGQLQTVSSSLWALGETATGAYNSSGDYVIDLIGSGGLQAVTVDAGIFQRLAETGKNLFVNAGADTTLILNVSDMYGIGLLDLSRELFLNGQNEQFDGEFDGGNVLINTNVKNVNVSNANINASILALDALFDIQGGHISGQVFGDSVDLTNGGELHAYYTFDDRHFDVLTPEPATFAFFAIAGVIGLSMTYCSRRKRYRCFARPF